VFYQQGVICQTLTAVGEGGGRYLLEPKIEDKGDMDKMNSTQWGPITSIQGAVTQQPIWLMAMCGDTWNSKEQWHEILRPGVGGKQLLEIMWRNCLPRNIVEEPGKFADTAAVWKYLDQLFVWNNLCDILQLHKRIHCRKSI
jgi:hypothetical protein